MGIGVVVRGALQMSATAKSALFAFPYEGKVAAFRRSDEVDVLRGATCLLAAVRWCVQPIGVLRRGTGHLISHLR